MRVEQGVVWALEHRCPLRTGHDWCDPEVTQRRLRKVWHYARGLRDKSIVGDVCVTTSMEVSTEDNGTYLYPLRGFNVSRELAPFGGKEPIHAACTACRANVSIGKPMLVGCWGYLDIYFPDFDLLDEHFERVITRDQLHEEIRNLFPSTSSLSYGLWIDSPLRRAQCQVLMKLFRGLPFHVNGVKHLRAALRTAIKLDLPMHVSMVRPGKHDWGWETVLPHCPRCKAEAEVEGDALEQPHVCEICHYSFVPAQTCEHCEEGDPTWDEGKWGDPPLADLLGAEEFDRFVYMFLLQQGCAASEAAEIIENHKLGPLGRRFIELRRKQTELRSELRRFSESEELSSNLTLDLGGGGKLTLRLIPDGEFVMGSTDSLFDGWSAPAHRVRIQQPFYMGEFPVSQAQYEAMMRSNPSSINDPLLPVDQVSWFDAQEFCLKLSQQTGLLIRLPSEAEWEYACRAGSCGAYHWGDLFSPEHANCRTNGPLSGADVKKILPPGRFPANSWGLYCMHGNVQEWCEDEWHEDYQGAPVDGTPWMAAEYEREHRVLRGGSYAHPAESCTSAARQPLAANRGGTSLPVELFPRVVGFRIVCDVGGVRAEQPRRARVCLATHSVRATE